MCETLVGADSVGLGIGAVSGDPQCIQKVELGGASFPHLGQKGIAMTAPMLRTQLGDGSEICVPTLSLNLELKVIAQDHCEVSSD
jgi:hypothetical protein